MQSIRDLVIWSWWRCLWI